LVTDASISADYQKNELGSINFIEY